MKRPTIGTCAFIELDRSEWTELLAVMPDGRRNDDDDVLDCDFGHVEAALENCDSATLRRILAAVPQCDHVQFFYTEE